MDVGELSMQVPGVMTAALAESPTDLQPLLTNLFPSLETVQAEVQQGPTAARFQVPEAHLLVTTI